MCRMLTLLLASLFFTATSEAQTFTVLYTFQWPGPVQPASGVTIDAAGNLYGTTLGSYGSTGTVYELAPRNGRWAFSLLFPFSGSNGNSPLARPVFGPDGMLYGTTSEGGFGCDLGCGNVYMLRPLLTVCRTALCYWTGSSIYDFDTNQDDGASPGYGDLLFDSNGDIYGTTVSNALGSGLDSGVVFELARSNGVWGETILHQFGSGNDGSAPESGLIRDGNGNLLGTTANGGSNSSCNMGRGCGTVYELSPSGSGWAEQVIYSFQGLSDGDTPIGGLVMDAAGNLYGTTSQDGAHGGGTIFELSPANGGWSLTTLYSFIKTGDSEPYCVGQNGNLLFDPSGNLYGTTCSNGTNGYGAVFKLTQSNGNWAYSSLHDFTNGDDGANPIGNPSLDGSGNIYGTASRGGAFLSGTVWKVTP